MIVTRWGFAAVLLVGCTKDAPPPQPPTDQAPPDTTEASTDEDEEAVTIDQRTRIEGPITEEQVDAVVQDNFTDVKKCFDAALVRMEADDLTGAIAIRIEIDGGGAVTEAALDASNFGDEETPQCILDDIEGWTFPASKKGEPSTVIRPFYLRSY